MKTKEKAIEFIEDILKQNSDINLKVIGGTACWKGKEKFGKDLSQEQWKHIGYVGALAWAYEIEKVSL